MGVFDIEDVRGLCAASAHAVHSSLCSQCPCVQFFVQPVPLLWILSTVVVCTSNQPPPLFRVFSPPSVCGRWFRG